MKQSIIHTLTKEPPKSNLSFWDKAFWIALGTSSVLALLIGAVFYAYTLKMQSSYPAEVVRVENERKEILTQKCFEPTKEFDEKYSAFLSNKSVSIDDPFEAANHPGDPLSAEASSLKVEKQLVKDACNDARTEASSIQEATEWNYFKAQWKKILN
jgi:hypothetical protein